MMNPDSKNQHSVKNRSSSTLLPTLLALIAYQPIVGRYMPMSKRGDLELVSFGCYVNELHLAKKVVIIQKSYDARKGC